jgi:hypothetical protein
LTTCVCGTPSCFSGTVRKESEIAVLRENVMDAAMEAGAALTVLLLALSANDMLLGCQ